ncbi:MAG TPA: hypothetical protein VF092_02865 [Longimicrobium sp.]
MRPASAAAAALALAACASTGVGDENRLTPAEVQGVYRFCTLRFTPVQTAIPAADLLTSVIDTTSGPGRVGASLTLSGAAPQFEMVYAARTSGTLRQVRGDVEFGEHSVFLFLTSQSPTIIQQEALLPPAHLDLVFDAPARRLTAGDEVSSYFVRRSDYARAAGISEEGLQDRIQGHVTATFSEGPCA